MPFDLGVFLRWDFFVFLGEGALLTFYVSTISQVIGVTLGLTLALLMRSPHLLLSKFAKTYIWIFRGTPLLVQLIIIYSGLPQIGIRLTEIQSAIIGLGLNSAAYIAEIFRASIDAIDVSQIEAARIDGANEFKAMQHIVLPQSLRIAIPPLGNEFIAMLKNSSLASAISLSELLHRTTLLISATYKSLELFIMAALFYLFMTSILTYLQSKLELHLRENVT
jgi:polar amino acid transport system permease protein